MRKDVAEQKEYGFSIKFQQFINEEKWQEVKTFATYYVVYNCLDVGMKYFNVMESYCCLLIA